MSFTKVKKVIAEGKNDGMEVIRARVAALRDGFASTRPLHQTSLSSIQLLIKETNQVGYTLQFLKDQMLVVSFRRK